MNALLFSFPTNEDLCQRISTASNIPLGKCVLRHFPDGESHLTINSDVTGKDVYCVASLYNPDRWSNALYFFARLVKDRGAKSVHLISPYLGYMRQDKVFHDGEAFSAKYFSEFISSAFDSLTTIDPHLHRIKHLEDLYTIPCNTLYAEKVISRWIANHYSNVLLVGPDSESEQWVARVAADNDCAYAIASKTRLSDRHVTVTTPDLAEHRGKSIVLVDDIISTARSLISTIEQCRVQGFNDISCVAVHPVFAEDGYRALQATGVKQIATCNTIHHETAVMDVSELIADAIT